MLGLTTVEEVVPIVGVDLARNKVHLQVGGLARRDGDLPLSEGDHLGLVVQCHLGGQVGKIDQLDDRRLWSDRARRDGEHTDPALLSGRKKRAKRNVTLHDPTSQSPRLMSVRGT